MFFTNCIEANQNGPYLWKSSACILYYLALIPPCIYATISIIKKMQYNFQMPFGIFQKFIRFGSRTLALALDFQGYSKSGFILNLTWYRF